MLIDADKIKVKDRIRQDFGDLKELAEDIRVHGLLCPVLITRDCYLIAGERRLRALKILGREQIPVLVVDAKDEERRLELEIAENEARKDFTKSERIEYARRLERIEAAKAKERQKATQFHGGGKFSTTEGKGKTRDEVAKKTGIGSGRQYEKEKAIVDGKRYLDPSDFADWDEGKLSTNRVYQKLRYERNKLEEENRKLALREHDLINQKAKLIAQKAKIAQSKEVEVVPEDYEQIKKALADAEELVDTMRDKVEMLEKQLHHPTREERGVKRLKDFAAGAGRFTEIYADVLMDLEDNPGLVRWGKNDKQVVGELEGLLEFTARINAAFTTVS